MKNRWMYSFDVEVKLGVSEEQLNRAIERMEIFHYFEEWIWYRLGPTNDLIVLFNLEFIDWLNEVYFNKNGFYLDREIKFLEKQIFNIENELNIDHFKKDYSYLDINGLQQYFDKSKDSILKAIERMNKKIECKCYKNKKLYITPEGVKWLDQKYYRKSYLNELIKYKQKLMEKERKND